MSRGFWFLAMLCLPGFIAAIAIADATGDVTEARVFGLLPWTFGGGLFMLVLLIGLLRRG